MKSGSRARRAIAMTAALLLMTSAGCRNDDRVADIGTIYRDAAMYESTRRRPVIVIPGILGSKLVQQDTNRIVWGAFAGEYADPSRVDGARLFALPMRKGAPLANLRDDVVHAGALDRVKLTVLGLPVNLNAYYNLLVTLGVGGFRDQQLAQMGAIDYGDKHYTCFQFAYDWRRSNVENAALLKAFMDERRIYLLERYRQDYGPGDYDIKFNIVAHSMGGLLTRYFLRYGDAPLPADGSLPKLTWAGADYVANAILVGTPNAGSVDALSELVHGSRPAPIVKPYPPALVGTLPAVYELMPRARHGAVVIDENADARVEDITNVATWRRFNWGLLDPGEDRLLAALLPDAADADERRAIAEDHLAKCLSNARQFWAALDAPTAGPPAGLDLYLYAGDAIQTAGTLSVDSETGDLTTFRTCPGDGTVTRYSALMDERQGMPFQPMLKSPIAWRHVTFLFESHIGLTQSESFSDNVLFQLLDR